LPERMGIIGGRGYKIGAVLFFRCKNLFVVSVSERCKRGPVWYKVDDEMRVLTGLSLE